MKTQFITTKMMFTPPPKPTKLFHGTTEWENESGVGSVCGFGDMFVCLVFMGWWGFLGSFCCLFLILRSSF